MSKKINKTEEMIEERAVDILVHFVAPNMVDTDARKAFVRMALREMYMQGMIEGVRISTGGEDSQDIKVLKYLSDFAKGYAESIEDADSEDDEFEMIESLQAIKRVIKLLE
jgi:hypothetical protein